MDGVIVCKTMLYSYKDLEQKCKEVDETLLRIGYTSYNANVFETFDKMANLMVEKIAYCNIKFIIDEAITKMKKSTELKYFHISGIDYKDIVGKYNINQRTLFRRLKRQRDSLTKNILSQYEVVDLFNIISDSKWLMNKYREFIAGKTKGLEWE